MCLSRSIHGDKLTGSNGNSELADDLSHIAGTDHPSEEQFNMLLNLLPPHTLAQVRDLNSISIDEADILMAAVNYILSLTNQLQNKLRWSENNNNNSRLT